MCEHSKTCACFPLVYLSSPLFAIAYENQHVNYGEREKTHLGEEGCGGDERERERRKMTVF